MKFKCTMFSKNIARILSFPIYVLSLPFMIIYLISFCSDSESDILWGMFRINEKIFSKYLDVIQFIYQEICGWYYDRFFI